MSIDFDVSAVSDLHLVRLKASHLHFSPAGTVRCVGVPLFKSRAARDLGCLLDVDSEVVSWTCLPILLSRNQETHVPDVLVTTECRTFLTDAGPTPDWAKSAAHDLGYQYEDCDIGLAASHRLANAKDLLRYAGVSVSLGDRVRLLTYLDEHGSLPLASCSQLIKNCADGIAAIASLTLQRVVTIELDEGPIGPDTRVSKA